MSNLEKLNHRIRTGFNRPATAKSDEAFAERCAEIYRILQGFDDTVLYHVNERFLDLYTKKQFPPPVDIERICHQVKKELDLKSKAIAFTSKQERQQQQQQYNDHWATYNLNHFGHRALDEGWHVEYYGFLAKHTRQPGDREIEQLRAAAVSRQNSPAAKIHQKKADNMAEMFRAQLDASPPVEETLL